MSNAPTPAASVASPYRSDEPHASLTATVLGGVIGNVIEWYDWVIYGALASVFAPQFFPAHDPITSLIVAWATFAVGSFMRPIGSFVLSPMADRYGRRKVLSWTIIMMGIGSLVIAVMPTYDSIGIAAPILVVCARMLQGFSAGGEFQGATTFLVEHAPANRRGLIGSTNLTGIGLAILVATGVGALTTSLIPKAELAAWGWRLPFLLGAVLSLYGIYVRRRLPETPAFIAIEQHHALAKHPLIDAVTRYPFEALCVFGIEMSTVPFYLWTIFLPTYAHIVGGLPVDQALIGSTISLAAFSAAVPIFGALSDVVGRKPLLLAWAVIFFLLTYPLLSLLKNGDFATFLFVDVVGCVAMAVIDGTLSAAFCELFPTRVRASGIGLPYAVCVALFGGTLPWVATTLISYHVIEWIAYYVMAICLLCGILFLFMKETRGKPLD